MPGFPRPCSVPGFRTLHGDLWIGPQQECQPFHRQADHVGKASPDDRDERVVVLHAVAARLPRPPVRSEVVNTFGIAQGPEPDDAALDGPDPFTTSGPI